MSAISNVAIAGASGHLGPAIIRQLLDDGFKVTVLVRQETTRNFPSGVTVTEIDYGSPESLTKGLEGQDAVVSVVGLLGLTQQIPLIEAAIEAGVKRFIPSEYGGDAENEKALQLPPFRAKKAITDVLKKEAASGSITYTLITTGPFLDLTIQYGKLVDLKEKKIDLWDDGDRPFSAATIPSTAKAVSGVLKHPEVTKNRNIFVRNATLTQKRLLEYAKKAVGSEGWTIEASSTVDVLKQAYIGLEKGETDMFGFMASAIWGEGYGANFQKVDNDLLGVKEFSEAEIQSLINDFAK
ncbi:putative oxidoreductase CipA-like protein [Jackrogersella minutella]|nr:putative oxidoreductase CipA-like protein [Jackrogersella minutella]